MSLSNIYAYINELQRVRKKKQIIMFRMKLIFFMYNYKEIIIYEVRASTQMLDTTYIWTH